jgi:hypothetical protein
MDDYLGWLTAGLIFLWILGVHDARAAPVDPGNARSEFSSLGASPSANLAFSSNGEVRAASGFAFREGRHQTSSQAGTTNPGIE